MRCATGTGPLAQGLAEVAQRAGEPRAEQLRTVVEGPRHPQDRTDERERGELLLLIRFYYYYYI